MYQPLRPAGQHSLPLLAVVLFAWGPTLQAQDRFTIDFRALGGANNPHPPIPQCQVVEQHDPPFPDSTGDCLHLVNTGNGQPIECLLAGIDECPALTIGAPPPGLFFATTSGLGVVDYDTTDPGACPLNCSPQWLLGENCGTIPGAPCFCDPNGCVGTPTPHGDWKDGLDFTHGSNPSNEEIRIGFGVPTLLSDLAFWRASNSELLMLRTDCPAPLAISYREGAIGGAAGDGSFTFPGGGLYLPANERIHLANPSYRPATTNDRIALQQLEVTLVDPFDQPLWRRACPYLAVPFDRGFVDISTDLWVRTDHDTVPTTDWFTSTSEASPSNCGLPNLTGGAAAGVCFASRAGLAGFDTSLTSRAFDLSTARAPHLHVTVAMVVEDEVLAIQTSTDGSVWVTQAMVSTTQPPGTELIVELAGLAYQPTAYLRFRYADPNLTDSLGDHLVLDDLVVFSDDGIFSDGFESGTTSRWQVVP